MRGDERTLSGGLRAVLTERTTGAGWRKDEVVDGLDQYQSVPKLVHFRAVRPCQG